MKRFFLTDYLHAWNRIKWMEWATTFNFIFLLLFRIDILFIYYSFIFISVENLAIQFVMELIICLIWQFFFSLSLHFDSYAVVYIYWNKWRWILFMNFNLVKWFFIEIEGFSDTPFYLLGYCLLLFIHHHFWHIEIYVNRKREIIYNSKLLH